MVLIDDEQPLALADLIAPLVSETRDTARRDPIRRGCRKGSTTWCRPAQTWDRARWRVRRTESPRSRRRFRAAGRRTCRPSAHPATAWSPLDPHVVLLTSRQRLAEPRAHGRGNLARSRATRLSFAVAWICSCAIDSPDRHSVAVSVTTYTSPTVAIAPSSMAFTPCRSHTSRAMS